MKIKCEVLEVYEPQIMMLREKEVPYRNIFVKDLKVPISKFIATIWGEWNITNFDIKKGEIIQLEFTIIVNRCKDGEIRNGQPKVYDIKKLSKSKENYEGDALYVIARTDKTGLKIGRSQNVKKRLKALQTSSNVELKIIALYKRCGFLEKEIHEQLEEMGLRLKGEWFKYCQDTYDVVKEICEEYGD